MKTHRTLSLRKRTAGLIVLAIFLTGPAHGWLHSASEFDDTGHFAEAEMCFLSASLATAPSMAEIGIPDWLHACASLQLAQPHVQAFLPICLRHGHLHSSELLKYVTSLRADAPFVTSGTEGVRVVHTKVENQNC